MGSAPLSSFFGLIFGGVPGCEKKHVYPNDQVGKICHFHDLKKSSKAQAVRKVLEGDHLGALE